MSAVRLRRRGNAGFNVRSSVAWHSLFIADDIATSGAAQDMAATWPDASGNGRHATQATNSLRPIRVANKINKRAAVYVQDGRYLQASFTSVPQPFSLYVVAQSAAPNQRALGSTSALLGISSGNLWFTDTGASLVSSVTRSGRVQRIRTLSNGAASAITVEGVTTTGAAGSNSIATLIIGKGNDASTLSGYIAFVGVKAGTFTAAETAALDAWAADYYGTATDDYLTNTAWSWWTRPRAVAINGSTFVGSTDMRSRVLVDEYLGTATSPARRHVIATMPFVSDDHMNPAVVLEPGKVPIVLYAGHAADSLMRWRKGTTAIENGFGSFSAEQTATVGGSATYCSAHVHGDNLWCFFRSGSSTWRFIKSTDWAGSFSAARTLFQHSGQLYMATALRGDTLRCAMSSHPTVGSLADQNVYYCEINLVTGDITLPGSGTAIANVSGTNLPLATTSLQVVGTPPVGQKQWVFDVSDGPEPEVGWVTMDTTSTATITSTSLYRYSVYTGGAWVTTSPVAAGAPFGGDPYMGGLQFPKATSGGRMYLCREASGTWSVEQHDTANHGSSYSSSVLRSFTSGGAATVGATVRAFPIEARDGTSHLTLALNEIQKFNNYGSFDSTIGLL